jgi:hypothetical protein
MFRGRQKTKKGKKKKGKKEPQPRFSDRHQDLIELIEYMTLRRHYCDHGTAGEKILDENTINFLMPPKYDRCRQPSSYWELLSEEWQSSRIRDMDDMATINSIGSPSGNITLSRCPE